MTVESEQGDNCELRLLCQLNIQVISISTPSAPSKMRLPSPNDFSDIFLHECFFSLHTTCELRGSLGRSVVFASEKGCYLKQ